MTIFVANTGSSELQSPQIPYLTVSILIKDANGHEICQSEGGWGRAGWPILQFLIVTCGPSAFTLPAIGEGAGGDSSGDSTVAVPTNTALLANLKSWAENQDWNTGYDWSHTTTSAGATVTPVSFDSINITEVTGTEFTSSDVTPA